MSLFFNILFWSWLIFGVVQAFKTEWRRAFGALTAAAVMLWLAMHS